MSIPEHRKWMVNRLIPNNGFLSNEFIDGVNEFDMLARNQHIYLKENVYRCPCIKCKNERFLSSEDVKVHLYRKGFMDGYWYWTSHGELEPPEDEELNMHHSPSSNHHLPNDANFSDVYRTMAEDAFGYDQHMPEPPNADAQKFYDILSSLEKPLWDGCTNHTELSTAILMMSIKSDYNMSQNCFNEVAQLMKEVCPSENCLPSRFNETKKIVRKLGLTSIKIDCCINSCMLYYKGDAHLNQCKFCEAPRYKPRKSKKKRLNNVPVQRMHYLPIIPRLKRLYASQSSAKHMRWHYENPREPGVLCHPSDGEAWKHFDKAHPNFASEPRNVRLGLCADGFSPFSSQYAKPYSCWPVILTPYNLPPEMCMTTPYMFLTCIIPGPKSLGSNIDVYLHSLIDELNTLWMEGVQTYDISRKENFNMKAALMWTINDFPAYGMLSGWSTHGKLACPICMSSSKAFRLKHGGKPTWFDCHRQFLPMDHQFRRNKVAFQKNKVENSVPPPRLTGEQIWNIVQHLPKVMEKKKTFVIDDFGKTHNWTKQSIFWSLPYWKTNLLPRNLDPMHIEKNVFDAIFSTVMDVDEKTKDNTKARMDLKLYCRRKDLELKEVAGKYLKPKAKFTFTMAQKKVVCQWAKDLKMPDDYSSYLANCVDVDKAKISGMKSHDCHVFMESLLPIAFNALPDQIWKPLTELSQFFRDICSTVLYEGKLSQMEENIVVILCKLERIFPPGLFNSMEHLPIHLASEAKLGGPVQYRWMYPFERYLGLLKRMVKNKARPEGSICEAYLNFETSLFCTYYFEPSVPCMRTRAKRNENDQDVMQPTLSVFNPQGRPSGKSTRRWLKDEEIKFSHLHVLLNCEEVQPYIGLFTEEKKHQIQNISDEEVDALIATQFDPWFRAKVQTHQIHDEECHRYLCQLALGPLREVTTWPIYFVNGYKFHTEAWSEGKSTLNCGVCAKGTREGDVENDFYGILKEVVEIEYPGEPIKKCVMFSCHWFDTTPNRGIRVRKDSDIVEIRHTLKYWNDDPFIFADFATQVYYVPYPEKKKDNQEWWVVIKTNPRSRVDNQYTLEIAYQEESMADGTIITDDVPIENMRDVEDINEEDDIEDIIETDIDEDGENMDNMEREEEEEEEEEEEDEDEDEDEEDEDEDEDEGEDDDDEIDENDLT